MMDWKNGDYCFVVTNRSKKYASEYEIVHVEENGFYFLKRVGSKDSYIRARKDRLFQTKEEAVANA